MTRPSTANKRPSTRTRKPSIRKQPVQLSSPDRIVEAITDGIRAGRFVPGQRLVEGDLTHSMGVSRGPVREALKRLAAEGIVALTPHRGAYIRAFHRDEAKKLLSVLEVLTGLAANLAAQQIRVKENSTRMREAYEHLRQIHEGGGEVSYVDERRHFYDTLIEIGGNDQIALILPSMKIQLLRMQIRSYWTKEEDAEHFNDYSLITSAVLSGDAQKAERLMKAHISRTRTALDRFPDAAFPIPFT